MLKILQSETFSLSGRDHRRFKRNEQKATDTMLILLMMMMIMI
jgi:hypothetical protein